MRKRKKNIEVQVMRGFIDFEENFINDSLIISGRNLIDVFTIMSVFLNIGNQEKKERKLKIYLSAIPNGISWYQLYFNKEIKL